MMIKVKYNYHITVGNRTVIFYINYYYYFLASKARIVLLMVTDEPLKFAALFINTYVYIYFIRTIAIFLFFWGEILIQDFK